MTNSIESQIAKRLHSVGIENAYLEARWILEKYNREEEIWKLVEKRCQGEPLAYLLQEKGFYKEVFFVRPGVLIPRPETELLVEISLSFLQASSKADPLILDFGCGSGCIGLSLLKEVPNAKLLGFDVSEIAVEVSSENAVKLGLEDRAQFYHQPMSDLTGLISRKADLIVANPPYIAEGDPGVERNVSKYEPSLALYSGVTGFEKIRSWSEIAFQVLKPGGGFAMEFGKGQEEEVQRHLEAIGFSNISVHKDLAKINRSVFAYKIEGL